MLLSVNKMSWCYNPKDQYLATCLYTYFKPCKLAFDQHIIWYDCVSVIAVNIEFNH